MEGLSSQLMIIFSLPYVEKASLFLSFYLCKGGVDILTTPMFYHLLFSPDVITLFETLDTGR